MLMECANNVDSDQLTHPISLLEHVGKTKWVIEPPINAEDAK